MKTIFYLFALTLFIYSCNNEQTSNETSEISETEEEVVPEETEEENLLAANTMNPRTYGGEKSEAQLFIDEHYAAADQTNEKLIGSYVGDFGPNMINITIYEAKNGKAEGFSVCAGNFRKIDGTFNLKQREVYDFVMNEPGDDQYDGKFEFTLNASEGVVEGKWTPFKEKGNSSRKYKLNKRAFAYDPTIGKYPQASQRELTDEDLSNMMEEELSEMRNEIYARHGYSFKNKDWRYHFEKKEWYMPMGVDIRDKLTDVEAINIELIYEYESYFQDYYDDYGR
ncbi:MAG: YARHG domain-containing protein [Crocinitomicaceae bacterium]